MDEKEALRKLEAMNLVNAMKELEQTSDIEQMLKDNIITFKINEQFYRVRKPTGPEQMEVEDYRRKRYVDFVKDPTYLFRKEWIEIYKQKNIDIEGMEKETISLQNEINALLLRLAKTENKADVEKLKNEIIARKSLQAKITVEKSELMNYSIEDQIIVAVNTYYGYIVLEKRIGDTWEKVFKNHQEFIESKDEGLINKTLYYINFLIYSNNV